MSNRSLIGLDDIREFMKIQRLIAIIVLSISTLFLCAFTDDSMVQLSHGDNHNVNVTYHNAQLKNDILTVTASYDSSGEAFQIGQDIVVSTDPNFETPLKITNCRVVDENYIYQFNIEDSSKIDTIYIRPPVLYKAVETVPVKVPLMEGQIVQRSIEATDFKTAGLDWFLIDLISVEEASETLFLVRINITSDAEELPRLARIHTEGMELGGLTVLYFDEEDIFTKGEFLYYIEGDKEEDIVSKLEKSFLVIENALIRMDETKTRSSLNVKALPVAVEEGQ